MKKAPRFIEFRVLPAVALAGPDQPFLWRRLWACFTVVTPSPSRFTKGSFWDLRLHLKDLVWFLEVKPTEVCQPPAPHSWSL